MLNQTFNELRLEQHPDKTLIGRAERGFDLLGYHFERKGLSVAVITITRLYEQGAANTVSDNTFSSGYNGHVQGYTKLRKINILATPEIIK